MTWNKALVYIWLNRIAIGVYAMSVITAFIKTAPLPGTSINWTALYAWAYDGLHQLFNITNTRLNPTPTITPPETDKAAK